MKFILYRDASNSRADNALEKNRRWRWRLVAKNGKIIADSGEAYSSRAKALKGIGLVQSTTTTTPFEDGPR